MLVDQTKRREIVKNREVAIFDVFLHRSVQDNWTSVSDLVFAVLIPFVEQPLTHLVTVPQKFGQFCSSPFGSDKLIRARVRKLADAGVVHQLAEL